MQNNGTWIFLSHSNKDIDKVRFIRNEFEKLGHKPLMFFLKCIDDSSELEDLIKREIKARHWFVLCDSENARNSKWVQEEIRMIKKLDGKFYETISLDNNIEKQIDKINNFSKRVTIFISYSYEEEKTKLIAQQMSKKFREKDYSVFLDIESLKIGEIWEDSIRNSIKKASQKGFFLLLIDKATFKNNFVLKELKEALKQNSNIIPVIVDELLKIEEIPDYILNLQFFDFSSGDLNKNIDLLIENLKTRKIY